MRAPQQAGSKNVMYKRYVSLGRNCEVAFQFRRFFGKENSSYFSWNVTSFDAAINLIKNYFNGVLLDKNIEGNGDSGMVWDRAYEYLFHTPFSTDVPQNDPEYQSRIDNHRQKAEYLINKFRGSYNETGMTAYFYVTDDGDCKTKSLIFRDTLSEKHQSKNFTVIILQDESKKEPSWGEECLENRYLKRLAPWADATDGHVSSYDRVFREFPIEGEVHYAGY